MVGCEQVDKQEFMKRAEYAFDTFQLKPENIFMFKLLNFEFEYDDEARTCTVSCPVTDLMLNPSGIVHGGILTFLADTSMGHLNFRLKDAPYISLELKTSFFKATASGKLVATGRYIKEGHKVCFMESEVRNEKGELLCKTTGTFYRFEKKKP